MRARNYLLTKYRRRKDPSIWVAYKSLRNRVKGLIREAKKDHFHQICEEPIQRIWKELNKVTGRCKRKSVNVIRIMNGSTLTEDSVIAEEFNQFFSNCVPPVDGNGNGSVQFDMMDSTFHFEQIDEDTVLGKLSHLSVKKATGVDGIPARLLKTAPAIVGSLTSLFNSSLVSGMILSEWKAANITPVPKVADGELVKDYRPISVLPIVAKVFEALVHTQLYSFLESGSLLHPAQSGFRPQRCTDDVLLKTIDDWRIALDQDEMVGTILIDLSKAIDHAMLLAKLEAYGVRGIEKKLVCELPLGTKTACCC